MGLYGSDSRTTSNEHYKTVAPTVGAADSARAYNATDGSVNAIHDARVTNLTTVDPGISAAVLQSARAAYEAAQRIVAQALNLGKVSVEEMGDVASQGLTLGGDAIQIATDAANKTLDSFGSVLNTAFDFIGKQNQSVDSATRIAADRIHSAYENANESPLEMNKIVVVLAAVIGVGIVVTNFKRG